MGWFIGIGIVIGIEIARIDDEVDSDSDSDSDSDFDALHEVAVDKLRIAGLGLVIGSHRVGAGGECRVGGSCRQTRHAVHAVAPFNRA